SILMVTFAIGFNLWLYRAEPTGMVDPNDNAFQYALVERTNVIWDYANRTCPSFFVSRITCHVSLLIDHWVPNWAEGYNLPYYYSHVPQIVIVGTYRFIHWASQFSIFIRQSADQISNFTLFEYYHWIIYLLLCFFPLSVFLSLRILRPSWFTAGIGALLASHISTDGLYGIDPASFLWRGWGLSSQLFAMIWMPLALAYAIRWINDYPFENAIGRQFFKELKIYLRKIVKKDNTANLHLARGKVLQDSDTCNRASLKNSLTNRGSLHFLYAILFITLTTMGHLGMGLMLFLTLPVIAFTQPFLSFLHQQSLKTIWEESKEAVFKVIVLALPPLILLSYWIIPTFLDSTYHNVSFWDPVWKFNSYGAKEVLLNLWNGYLFDWGRLPIYTILVFFGLFVCLFIQHVDDFKQKTEDGGQRTDNFQGYPLFSDFRFPFSVLSFLFIFFLLLYFGKTTWGGILDFIPGMNEFHQHRFIVGVHLIGLFLAPIGVSFLVQLIWQGGTKFSKIASRALQFIRLKYKKTDNQQKSRSSISLSRAADRENLCYTVSQLGCVIVLSLLIIPQLYSQTLSYAKYNETLIQKANATFSTQKADAELLLQTLRELVKEIPGRVFAGRGGGWGKNFSVAESAYYMYLSTYGIPTILWLPETWSLNSDTEQYFSEDNPSHYELFNVRYVVAPPSQTPQKFWNLLKETSSWKLYEVNIQEPGTRNQEPTIGYITTGVSPSLVLSDKLSFGNVVRLWIQSNYPEKNIFPELRISSKSPKQKDLSSPLPRFLMLDEANYITPDGKTHSLFQEPPKYVTPWEWPSAFAQYPINNTNTSLNNQEPGTKNQELSRIQILSQSNDTDMVFKAMVKVKDKCPTCTVVLKQTFHPNWKATVYKKNNQDRSGEPVESTTVNGKPVQTISVFPFYTAIRLEEAGEYEVVFTYTPSTIKMVLLGLSVVLVVIFFIIKKR
ncbi:hypothetical protein MUP56_01685, partial [Patescibacteria group bacterium]|nr:hypothetical protein [Patescibacteria group bacterium]